MAKTPSVTTLASQVRENFQRFAIQAAPKHPPITVLEAWRKTLDFGPSPSFFEAFALVDRSLLLLIDQINRSVEIDDEMRPVAETTK